jgi:hypothetical protein
MNFRNLDFMGSGRLLTARTNDIEAWTSLRGHPAGTVKDIFLLIGLW